MDNPTINTPAAGAATPLLWHYTTLIHWPRIAADNFILRPGVPDGRPALWFSANQIAELTVWKDLGAAWFVRKGLPGGVFNFLELAEHVGIIRIGIDRKRVRTWHFRKWERRAHPPKGVAAVLAKSGVAWGANPDDWHFTFESVAQRDWAALEFLLPVEHADLTLVTAKTGLLIGESRRPYCYMRVMPADITAVIEEARERAQGEVVQS